MPEDILPQTSEITAEDPAATSPATPEQAPETAPETLTDAPTTDAEPSAPNDPTASPVDAQPAADSDPSTAGEPQGTDAPAADGVSGAPSDESTDAPKDAPVPTDSEPTPQAPTQDAPAADAPAQDPAAEAPGALEPVQAPVGQGYPLPTGNPIAHPTTGAPLPAEQQPGGEAASGEQPTQSAPSDAPVADAPASEPAPVEPPASVPAAPTTPDVYGLLTQQGAQIVADAEKLAENAGVVLAARIKTVANAAASLNDMIRAIISESEDDAADELASLSNSLESLAYSLAPFIGDAGDADGNNLHDKIEAAVQGLEDHLKEVFKKLTGA